MLVQPAYSDKKLMNMLLTKAKTGLNKESCKITRVLRWHIARASGKICIPVYFEIIYLLVAKEKRHAD